MEKIHINVKEIKFQPSNYNKKSKDVYNTYNMQDCSAYCDRDCPSN